MVSEPAYVKTFKEFIKRGATKAHFDDLAIEFHGQSDRTTIILAATIVDDALTETIKRLLRDHGSVRALSDPDGAPETFSAKISLAFGLKIFETKTKHDLDLIRLLRNGCAHSQIPITFKLREVRAVCDHLLLPNIHGIAASPQTTNWHFQTTRRTFRILRLASSFHAAEFGPVSWTSRTVELIL